MQEKVLLGISGGIDSAVSAIILKEAGYKVIGGTLNLYGENEELLKSAEEICHFLKIPHYIFDYQEEFKRYVIENFINSYKCGRTPNPCVLCNKYFKFGYFYKKAQELGCKYIATGHYAKSEFSKQYNRYVLKKSKSNKKDQTYFLYNISKDILKDIIFPLSNYLNKDEIRKIAIENHLPIYKKSESQEVCFIKDNNYSKFLIETEKEEPKRGNIILKSGEILGYHEGLINYTIGQRKGLKIAYPKPLYVLKLNTEKNELIVGEEKELYSKELIVKDMNLLAIDKITTKMNAKAKIRYRAEESDCIITPIDSESAKVEFENPQRAITPGQSVVFYKDDIVLGGGIID